MPSLGVRSTDSDLSRVFPIRVLLLFTSLRVTAGKKLNPIIGGEEAAALGFY